MKNKSSACIDITRGALAWTEPLMFMASTCGCKWQYVDYPEQLRLFAEYVTIITCVWGKRLSSCFLLYTLPVRRTGSLWSISVKPTFRTQREEVWSVKLIIPTMIASLSLMAICNSAGCRVWERERESRAAHGKLEHRRLWQPYSPAGNYTIKKYTGLLLYAH